MATRSAWLLAGALSLAACTTVQTASTGSSAPYRAGTGIVESVRLTGVAAPSASVARQGTPPGASVYSSSTYAQPAYSYPSSSPGFATDAPQEPAPGGVSARTDIYEVAVRMDDGSRQVLRMAEAPARGERVQISPEGHLTKR